VRSLTAPHKTHVQLQNTIPRLPWLNVNNNTSENYSPCVGVKITSVILVWITNCYKWYKRDHEWHSCVDICYLKSKTIIVLLLSTSNYAINKVNFMIFSPLPLSCHSTSTVTTPAFRVTEQYVTRSPYTPCHNSKLALDWMFSGFVYTSKWHCKDCIGFINTKRASRRYETHNNT